MLGTQVQLLAVSTNPKRHDAQRRVSALQTADGQTDSDRRHYDANSRS